MDEMVIAKIVIFMNLRIQEESTDMKSYKSLK